MTGYYISTALCFLILVVCLVVPPSVCAFVSWYSWSEFPRDLAGRILAILVSSICVAAALAHLQDVWPFGKPRNPQAFLSELLYKTQRSYDEYTFDNRLPPEPQRVYQPESVRRYKVIKWNPPKHTYVSLQDAETGVAYHMQYVSKHCSAPGPKLGEEFNLKVHQYRMDNAPASSFLNVKFLNLQEAFCQ